ncbi:transcription factor [Fusarium austroafricanum]|uniref:Transcription factor n=1 Tax=Fusarium austroafricanum TaxID=2364996 RepID=A0A8H4KNB1_9HYPO|nr:transcription factor [Fusarium austroafricanum]
MSNAALHGTACIVCRRRGRKCDRTLPTCSNCEKRGVACEGYVTKWPGVAARGKLAGKSIPIVDSSFSITETRPRHTRAQQRLAKKTSASQCSPGNAFSSVPDDEIDKFVQHYIADNSSIFFLGNGLSENPMFHYVLPLINTVPPIRFALAGSASCHIAARTSNEALEQKSLRLRVHSTHLLRQMLQDPTATDQNVLASILMLAQLDMCSGDCIEFETHLKAAASVIRSQSYNGSMNGFYFEQRLAWSVKIPPIEGLSLTLRLLRLDVMRSTTSSKPPNLNIEEVKTIIGRVFSNGSRQWSYDVFPCPIDLFEIIIEITFLFKGEHAMGKKIQQISAIESRLRDWKCPAISGPRKHMVEIWRYGVIAYLKRLFPSVHHETDLQDLSRQVFELAEFIPSATSWSYSMLWPIFQVAVSLDEGAMKEKDQIRRRLRIALETIGCRHHSNALEVLEVVWAGTESYDPFTISMSGKTIMLV